MRIKKNQSREKLFKLQIYVSILIVKRTHYEDWSLSGKIESGVCNCHPDSKKMFKIDLTKRGLISF